MIQIFEDIEVNTQKINIPTESSFFIWREEFLSKCDLTNYNLLFCGNFAEQIYGISKIPTKDVDIIISSNKDLNYCEIKNILKTAFILGIKNNLFIDIFHVNYNVFETCYGLKFVNNSFVFNNILLTRFFQKIITKKDNNTVHVRELDNFKKINNELYQLEIDNILSKSLKKAIKRIKQRQYVGIFKDLKTMNDIQFDYFFKNIDKIITTKKLI
jgi:hypothetical protein